MANVAQLKEKARSLELKEQWKAALEVYERILEGSDGEDSGLWNRVGDVRARLGQSDAAVEAYERAVDLYVEAGLHNNAIALCNKILRVTPDRAPAYLRLGQISAAQGFLADARNSFLQYAERMQRAGKLDESFAALDEFAALSPEDAEVRRLLADQLSAHDRGAEALEHLRALHGLLTDAGDTDAAAAVRAEMLAIDPDTAAEMPRGAPQRASRHATADEDDDTGLLPTLDIHTAPSAAAPPAPEVEPQPGMLGEIEFSIDTTSAGDTPSVGTPPVGEAPAAPEGLETTQLDDFDAADLGELRIDAGALNDIAEPVEVPGLEYTAPEDLAEESAEAALPLLDDIDPGAALITDEVDAGEIAPLAGFEATLLDDAGDGEGAEIDAAAEADDAGDAGDAEAAEAAESSAAPHELEPLPMLEPSADASDEPTPLSLDGSGAALGAAFDEPAAVQTDGADADDEPLPLLIGFDEEPAAVELPGDEPALEELDSAMAGHEGDALEELRRALERAPGDEPGRATLIEVLYERGRGAEAEALLEEAHRALAAEDRFVDALAVLRSLIAVRGDDLALHQKQVEYAFRASDRPLLVDAYLALAARMQAEGNAEKAKAIYERVLELDGENEAARAALAPRPGAGRRARAGGSDDYVDLAALIFDEDEEGEPSTRFVVPEEEPTGDEARDFADMLAVFKQKVAANIDATDSTSHYDLGLAFKDMGLLDEAIAQFQVALRGGANPLATLEVLGECFVEKNQPTLGARVLERALRLPGASEASLIGVHYWLGRCAEAQGDGDAAADHYERAVALDIRFRDAAARLGALREAPAGAAFDKGQRAG